MKNNIKIYIILITFFILLAIALFTKVYIIDTKTKGYIIFSGNNIYYKNHDNITKYEKDVNSLTAINVITSSGNYNLNFKYRNQEVLYFIKKEQTVLDGDLQIAYSKGLDLDLIEFNTSDLDIEELQKASDILKENGIIGYETLSSEKLEFDFNQDGTNETIYFITNLFDESIYEKVFAFAYYIEYDNVYYLIKEIDDVENTYDLCVPRANSIIKINDDYELVISCDYFSNIGSDIYFYQNKTTLFEEVSK
jgi:hypothetical protein